MANCEIPSLENTIDGRRSMRSVADAIEALRNAQSLTRNSHRDQNQLSSRPNCCKAPPSCLLSAAQVPANTPEVWHCRRHIILHAGDEGNPRQRPLKRPC